MVIKWKGWTARLPVKIACLILIPVMGFVFLLSFARIEQIDNLRGPDMLFADFHSGDYFFGVHMGPALNHLETVFALGSEERIRSMEHLEWNRNPDQIRLRYGDGETFYWYELRSLAEPFMHWHWGSVDVPADGADAFLESSQARSVEASAIEGLLSHYRTSRRWLQEQAGLYYVITDGARTLSNLPSHSQIAGFFREQPVYFIAERAGAGAGMITERMASVPNHWRLNPATNATVYIAFSQEVVQWQNALWLTAQRQFARMLGFMAFAVVASLACLIILIKGAGRVYGDESGRVHLSPMDKPWLDFGLAMLVGYTGLLFVLFIELANMIFAHGPSAQRSGWILLLCATLSIGFTLPVVWWVTSVAKRVKTGEVLRHTLTFALYRELKKLARSLWAGIPLTGKVTFIGCALLLMGVLPFPFGLIFVPVAVLLMLRFARRLHLVQKGAAAASGGDYSAPIEVNGGELGSIADSINNISEGTSRAVTQQMKSERLKTELITNVSHDIRTPLTSLITYTDLLKSEGLASENAPEYLEVLVQKSGRLKTLTDDLFEASKAASGSVDVSLENIDFADFVRQAFGELSESVRASGLDFRLNLPDHAVVRADGRLLWRVVENLLSNVCKYALAGSRVYVDITCCELWCRLDIKNISAHPLNVDPSELAERFKRGDSARTGEGSGLGLSIAQSFTQLQGGRFEISIDGDLFKVTLHLPKGQ